MKRAIPVSDANHRRIVDRAYLRSQPGEPIAPVIDAVIGEMIDALEREERAAAEVRRAAMQAVDAYAAIVCACPPEVACSCRGVR